ncbi:hypothetical protein B7463_g2029, partial [Scytalidium lignicola]
MPSPCGPAPPEALYTDLPTLFASIQAFARKNGYAFFIRRKLPKRVVYMCDRSGNYQSKGKKDSVHFSKQRKSATKKCNCKMRVDANAEGSGWRLQVIEPSHNHEASMAPIAHPAHRLASLAPSIRAEILSKIYSGIPNHQVLNNLRIEHPQTLITSSDITNIVQAERLRALAGRTPIQWLLAKLKERGFNPSYLTNSTNNLTHLFYVHPKALELYQQHPDILLMDCTYKTNRFHLPLLNICAITGGNKVIQFGLVFLSDETEKSYDWALNRLGEVMKQHCIQEPLSIVTDREVALMNSIDTYFPNSFHSLCRWHVNMNILAKTKRFFPPPVKEHGVWKRDATFQEFLKLWGIILDSPSFEAYTSNLTKLWAYPDAAVNYVTKTWLNPWKEKLVQYWLDQHLHFGVLVTSPIEGCHSTLKAYLQRGNGDLNDVFERLLLFWAAQQTGIEIATSQERLRRKHHINIHLFSAVLGHVYDYALEKIVAEKAKIPKAETLDITKCKCTIQRAMGLPCYHQIWERERVGGVIYLEDLHAHWYYNKPKEGTPVVTNIQAPILNPKIIQGKGRPKGAFGKGRKSNSNILSGTKRLPSAFELPSSSAPPALEASVSRELAEGREIYITRSGRTATKIGLQRIQESGEDTYEPGTAWERGYQRGISSIFHTDSMEETAKLADKIIQSTGAWDAVSEPQETQDFIEILP